MKKLSIVFAAAIIFAACGDQTDGSIDSSMDSIDTYDNQAPATDPDLRTGPDMNNSGATDTLQSTPGGTESTPGTGTPGSATPGTSDGSNNDQPGQPAP